MRPGNRRRPASGRRPRALIAALAAVLVAVLTLGACSGSGDSGSEATGQPADAGAGAVEGDIVVASGRDVTGKGGIRQKLIEQWNRQQEDKGSSSRARLVELPGSADQQRSQLLGALQSGSAEYDVVNLDVTWVPEFADAGLVRRLPDDLVDADVIPSVAATAGWDGKLYAVPFNSDVGLLFYRRDYLKKAGVTDTELGNGTEWSTVQKLIGTVGDAGRSAVDGYEKGWTTQLAPYEGLTVNGIEALASAVDGLRLTDDAGRYTGSVQDLEAGLKELRDRTQAPYTLGDAGRSDEAESLGDFADGRTAFLRHWPYAYRTLHQSLTDQQLGVAPLPGRAVLGGQNLAVTTASKRGPAAQELIRFLTGHESERCLLDAGFAATRLSAYNDNGLTCRAAKPPGPANPSTPSAESTDRMPRDEHGRPKYARDTLLPTLQNAVQRPRTPLYGAFTQTFTTELRRLYADKPPLDAELAKDLHTKLKTALPHT
ncbi:extracellular solute-binding protein [Streptomyces sp. NBC_00555]|uniref:extracellular solute-binding protein n=1 Tax=Streptomyces sp. NBC_00555 TaxID=2903662 RepID=UPI00224EE06A|nr:extracellular solute-binding protein [Streptomyces sp. NBC_00555]MCX5009889.1 extracellular solute-binding protein [Streptomyces sp. NBC_00555]